MFYGGLITIIASRLYRVTLFLMLSLAVSAAAFGAVLSPSQLNAKPLVYKDRVVLVRGFITLEPEGHTLYESRELDIKFRKGVDGDSEDFHMRDYIKYCLTIANPGLLYRNRATLHGRTLVVKGTFLSDYLRPGVIDLGACPLPTAIMIDVNDLKHRYGRLLPNP